MRVGARVEAFVSKMKWVSRVLVRITEAERRQIGEAMAQVLGL